MLVFFIITITWVFFRFPSVTGSLRFVCKMLLFHPLTFLTLPNIMLTLCGTVEKLLGLLAVCPLFLVVQFLRKDEVHCYLAFERQPIIAQTICIAAMLCICIFTVLSGTAAVNMEFVYFQF